VRGRGLDAFFVAFALVPLCYSAPVRAQVAASATLTSDYQFQGVSLSDGKPALGVNLSYDHYSGAYVGASLVGQDTAAAGVEMLGEIEYLGYAGELKNGPGWDVGYSNFNYSEYYSYHFRAICATCISIFNGKYIADTNQLYTGILQQHVSFYIYYSPNYFGEGVSTVYADLSGAWRPTSWLRLFGHVGVLSPFGGSATPASHFEYQPWLTDHREQYDLRAGVAVAIRHAEVQLAWTTRRPDDDYLAQYQQRRDALVASLSWFF
jgi:uncharacterized protein (TIGR02001 family)